MTDKILFIPPHASNRVGDRRRAGSSASDGAASGTPYRPNSCQVDKSSVSWFNGRREALSEYRERGYHVSARSHGLITANSRVPTPMSGKIVDCLVETVGVTGNLLDAIRLLVTGIVLMAITAAAAGVLLWFSWLLVFGG